MSEKVCRLHSLYISLLIVTLGGFLSTGTLQRAPPQPHQIHQHPKKSVESKFHKAEFSSTNILRIGPLAKNSTSVSNPKKTGSEHRVRTKKVVIVSWSKGAGAF